MLGEAKCHDSGWQGKPELSKLRGGARHTAVHLIDSTSPLCMAIGPTSRCKKMLGADEVDVNIKEEADGKSRKPMATSK